METGAFKKVARLIQTAAQSKVASIIVINSSLLQIKSLFIISHFIVSTTSHQAIIAPPASNITAIKMALHIVKTFAQTAGHILFATSLAHRFKAIYIAKRVAKIIYQFSFHH
ncbi:MAG: hypothetical protein LBD88_00490 [Candidatus Peribacteria bacterium]|nr:hypothetical protein [Candidatus Peribacteria bacterium]